MDHHTFVDGKCRTLFVGLACVDLFTVMAKYPEEDKGCRCLDYYKQLGGNASNSSRVHSLLGGSAVYIGTIAEDSELRFLLDGLAQYGVDHTNAVIVPGKTCPLSVVILSQESKTRTVLHTNKDLPELTLEDFERKIDLGPSYGWIHFEGRDNAWEITCMLKKIHEYNETHSPRIITSLEAEKLRFASYLDKYEMWKLPDVMFVSKDFALSQGYNDMDESVKAYHAKVKDGAILICAWGEMGAAAMSSKSGVVYSPAFPPETVVDTCGAGDTFNAAILFALQSGRSLQDALVFGCKVAGAKCGLKGLEGLKEATASL